MSSPALNERIAALLREARSFGAVLQLLAAALAVALLPLLPGMQGLLGVTLADTTAAMTVYVVAMVAATVAYHMSGLSRAYWIFDDIESWCSLGVLLYLVYASGTAVSVFWLFYILHGLFAATSAPRPRHYALIPYVVLPLLLAGGFLLRRDAPADAALSVVVGGAYLWAVLLLTRTTRRIERLMQDKAQLADEVAALRVHEERSRIARDLHDGLGATMTSVLWQARALEASFQDHTASAHAAELCQRVTESLEELRAVVSMMRATAQDFQPFAESLARRCGEVARVPVTFRCQPESDGPILDGALASECMNAALEMVRNADRHANASRIALSVEAGQRLRIVVEDDGRGMEAQAAAPQVGGLSNLLQRARALGGTFEVSPRRPGTQVAFDVPLATSFPHHPVDP